MCVSSSGGLKLGLLGVVQVRSDRGLKNRLVSCQGCWYEVRFALSIHLPDNLCGLDVPTRLSKAEENVSTY